MAQTLYRKYRPKTFEELIGQNHIKVTLQNEIETDKIAHAYLFTGPRGIGKTTTARLLAKALNCTNRQSGQSEPCNTCESCTELMQGNDLDVVEIDAASHTGVDNVRENIIQNARFTPAKRKFKVFIIDEVHMLSISAFNALLKILEEPPEHAMFVLCTTEIHKIPATIISRCQRFDFKKVNTKDVMKRLTIICTEEGVTVDKAVLKDIARRSEGCLRDAESLLGQILSLGEKEISQEQAALVIPQSHIESIVALATALHERNVSAGIELINSLVEQGMDLYQFTGDFVEFLRKVLLAQFNEDLKTFSIEIDEALETEIQSLSKKFTASELIEIINSFSSKKNEIKNSVIIQMPLELAVVEFCQKPKNMDVGSGKDDEDKGDNEQNPSSKLQTNTNTEIQNSKKDDGENDKSQQDDQAEKNDQIPNNNDKINSNSETQNLKSEEQQDASNHNPPSHKATKGEEGEFLDSKEDKDEDVCIQKDAAVNLKTSIDDVRKKWHEFIVSLQELNASLTFVLKVTEPLKIHGNCLKLGVKYPFHCDRLNNAQVKSTIENNLEKMFNEVIAIEPILLDKDHESDFISQETQQDEVELVEEIKSEGDDQSQETIDKLVKAFGGKIVE